jgi:hypothetical protein
MYKYQRCLPPPKLMSIVEEFFISILCIFIIRGSETFLYFLNLNVSVKFLTFYTFKECLLLVFQNHVLFHLTYWILFRSSKLHVKASLIQEFFFSNLWLIFIQVIVVQLLDFLFLDYYSFFYTRFCFLELWCLYNKFSPVLLSTTFEWLSFVVLLFTRTKISYTDYPNTLVFSSEYHLIMPKIKYVISKQVHFCKFIFPF